MANESGRRSILVVEDNELNREMLCAMLEDRYNVLQAENGKEGLEVLQEYYRDISIIVLDVQMPVMNGYEFLNAVKDDDLLKEIPVIVATGSSDVEEEESVHLFGHTEALVAGERRQQVVGGLRIVRSGELLGRIGKGHVHLDDSSHRRTHVVVLGIGPRGTLRCADDRFRLFGFVLAACGNEHHSASDEGEKFAFHIVC